MIKSEQTYREYPHHLDNPDSVKIIKSLRNLTKSEERLIKAKALRIWIKNTPQVNLFTYLYYRIRDRKLIKQIIKRLGN